jgi:hypothetical protein
MNAQGMMLAEKVGEGILAAAEAEERALDAKLQQLENLGMLISSFLCLDDG